MPYHWIGVPTTADLEENANFNFGYRRVEPIGIVLETTLVWFCMILLLIFAYYMHLITTDDKPLRPALMLLTAIVTLIGDFARVVVVYGCGVLRYLFRYPWLTRAERENTKIKKGSKEISIRRVMEGIKGSSRSSGGLLYDTLVLIFSILICVNDRFLVLDKLSTFFLIGIIFYSTMPNFKRNLKILMEGNLRRRALLTKPCMSPKSRSRSSRSTQSFDLSPLRSGWSKRATLHAASTSLW